MRKVAILELPFRGRDEFLPLTADFEVAWVKPFDFQRRFPTGADVLVLPGSGKTTADLDYLSQHGGRRLVQSHLSAGGTVIGVCGGFQSLGGMLYDPFVRQGNRARVEGMGWLPVDTTFGAKMLHSTTQAACLLDGGFAEGVEHRSGVSFNTGGAGEPLFAVLNRQLDKPAPEPCTLVPGIHWAPGTELVDGWVTPDRKVWGTYLHRVFHNEAFVRLFFGSLP